MLSRHPRSIVASLLGSGLVVVVRGRDGASATARPAAAQQPPPPVADRLQGHAEAAERQVAHPRRRAAAAARRHAGPVRRSAGAGSTRSCCSERGRI